MNIARSENESKDRPLILKADLGQLCSRTTPPLKAEIFGNSFD